ncbi:hypothetical protein [Xanthomonas arboricola]|uniref:hypothetical protein n=1 Tax=Xanthomonas arboricola TaxID=56448 RepID=UPI0011AFEC31|nr:hypothetical protein [Xanthomonas arboricola]
MRTLDLHIATTQFCLGTNTNIPTSSPARALAEDGGKLRTRTLAFAKKKSNKRITVMMGTHSNASHLHAKEKSSAKGRSDENHP